MYVVPTQSIILFPMVLRTNCDYFPLYHKAVGFYNPEGVCLLRGTK